MESKRIVMVATLAAIALGGCSSEKPVEPASTKEMMLARVQPEAQHYWDSVQYISDEKGLREVFPANDAEWERTAQAARELKATGEELKGAKFSAGRGGDWIEFSQGLVDAAAAAEAAALTKKPEAVLEAGGTIYNVCSACHEVYMPNPTSITKNPFTETEAAPAS